MAAITDAQVSATLALTDLVFADDIAIRGERYKTVQERINGVHDFAAKTKMLAVHVHPSNCGTIK